MGAEMMTTRAGFRAGVWMILAGLSCLAISPVFGCSGNVKAAENSKLRFWETQKKGTNFFNRNPARARFESAAELGVEFIRLVPDKWASSGRDFLIGNADQYAGIPPQDLARLDEVLRMAGESGHKVVLSMLSLPGARWRQNNADKDDGRLWEDQEFLAQAERFWKELATHLAGRPEIVAYNPLNEPHPERSAGVEDPGSEEFAAWVKAQQDSTHDLNRFYGRIVSAIRAADPETPILLDGYGFASPDGLSFIEPLDQPGILYAFHFYDPWNFTTKRINNGRFSYPNRMPVNWEGETKVWTIDDLRSRMQVVRTWAERHGIPASQIVAAEFGCNREVEGAAVYLSDLVTVLNENGWHWAFYSYREDVWTGMDYELGTRPYWRDIDAILERGEMPQRPWKSNPLFEVLRREFQGKRQ